METSAEKGGLCTKCVQPRGKDSGGFRQEEGRTQVVRGVLSHEDRGWDCSRGRGSDSWCQSLSLLARSLPDPLSPLTENSQAPGLSSEPPASQLHKHRALGKWVPAFTASSSPKPLPFCRSLPPGSSLLTGTCGARPCTVPLRGDPGWFVFPLGTLALGIFTASLN